MERTMLSITKAQEKTRAKKLTKEMAAEPAHFSNSVYINCEVCDEAQNVINSL
jgi:hypothetical protein